ncbi:MAG: 5-formyltetrahydrofolate cyclo-ligase [Bacteroidales bacterium]|nr:5-formyltetrahydrofolate cyclo-ligase [Bacteroidales bacterium]
MAAPAKKEIRLEMRRRESEFRDWDSETELIWRSVESTAEFQEASCVMIYMAMPGEVPTKAFIDKWRGVKRFAIPLVEGDGMRLCEYDPEKLVSGYRGIVEPSSEAVGISPGEVQLALVPGVAFSIDGDKVWRLGRGKGFYDRFLPSLNCPRFGIFFSFRVLDSIPLEEWDLPLGRDIRIPDDKFSL